MSGNILSDEGKKLAKRAERAEEEGNFEQAIEFYHKASRKFKEATELCDDFNEIGILRSSASYYINKAGTLIEKLHKTGVIDPSMVIPAEKKNEKPLLVADLLKGTGISEEVFGALLKIAIEISREGREGRAIGTAFIIGDAENVMARSRQLVLNPFHGHSKEERMITDTGTQGNIKEFAQLDGVFVISEDGIVEAAGRYITIDTGMAKIPKGLGTRHSSVAAITSATGSIGIVVSQSGGVIRILRNGKIAATLKS